MTTSNRGRLGRRGEALAAEALGQHGFRVIERNWRCAMGEVDLIVERGEHIHFVEVRTRRAAPAFSPELSLTRRKAERMTLVALTYLGSHPAPDQATWHVSFVAVAMDERGTLQRITLYTSLEAEPVELLPPRTR
jgi:putative endonuclease